MRLTYLIRRINLWFGRVVYERDAWDDWLVHSTSESGHWALMIVLGLWASDLSNSLDRRTAMDGVLGDPAAARLSLGQSSQIVIGKDGRAVLLSSLSHAPRGKTYELWVITGSGARPAGLFAEGKSGSPVLLVHRIPRGAQVGLSIERAGGAKHPTDILSVTPPV